MDGLIGKIVSEVMSQRGPRTIISKQVNVDGNNGDLQRPNYQKQKAEERLRNLSGNKSSIPANDRVVNKAVYQSGNVGPIKTGYGPGSMNSELNSNIVSGTSYQPGNLGPEKNGYGPASVKQDTSFTAGTSNLQLLGYNETTNQKMAASQNIATGQSMNSNQTGFFKTGEDPRNLAGFEKSIVETIKRGGQVVQNRRLRGTGDLLGVAKGSTVGYVIPNLDPALKEQLQLAPEIRAIGILSSRFGSAPQIMAADEAVKKTNTKILSIQMSRDGKENFGHGVFILFGSEEVAEVTDAIEIALKATNDFYNGIYEAGNGRIEVHFTARAAEALSFAFKAPLDNAFGIIIGSPAGIGLIMSDVALKTAHVDVTYFWGPSTESAFANEVWLMITGNSAAVKNALEAAAQVGQEMIKEL